MSEIQDDTDEEDIEVVDPSDTAQQVDEVTVKYYHTLEEVREAIHTILGKEDPAKIRKRITIKENVWELLELYGSALQIDVHDVIEHAILNFIRNTVEPDKQQLTDMSLLLDRLSILTEGCIESINNLESLTVALMADDSQKSN